MPKKMSPKVARSAITAAEKSAKAVELYTQGYSLRRVAELVGYAGPSGAHKAIKTAIRNIPSRSVEERRVEIDERSRLALEQLMPVVLNKKADLQERLSAFDRVLRIDKQLRELHGTDAPEAVVQLNADVSPQDVRQELLDRLARLAESASQSADPPEAQ